MFSSIVSLFSSIFCKNSTSTAVSSDSNSSDMFSVAVPTTTESPRDFPSTGTSHVADYILPVMPPPAAHQSSLHAQDDMMADFFGGRRDRSRLRDSVPPPYSPGLTEELPVYTSYDGASAPSLAHYMFTYGFLFPPFWIMGAIILLTPLRPTPEWEMGKSEDERTRLLADMRNAETKWAWRCLIALVVLLALAGIVTLVVLLAKLL